MGAINRVGLSAQEVDLLGQASDSFYSAMELMVWRENGTVAATDNIDTQIKALIEAGVRNTARFTMTMVRQSL
jgi:hypothetical protein